MIAELRRLANEAAQAALHAFMVDLLRTGKPNPDLALRYSTAERLVDLADETYQRMQLADPEAPDYFAMFVADGSSHDPVRDPGDHFVYPDSAA